MDHRCVRGLALAGSIGLLASGALAVSSPASGSPIGGKVAILGAPAEPAWNADVRAKLLSTGFFSAVQTFDISAGRSLPSLATLSRYRAVLVFSDAPLDGRRLGDRLADYCDLGGGVVAASFALIDGANEHGLSGRIVTGDYLPFRTDNAWYTGGTHGSAVKVNGGGALFSGVRSFDGGSSSYHNTGLGVVAGSILRARWSSDGEPLAAVRLSNNSARCNVVGLNFYPPSSTVRSDFWNARTSGARLMSNALLIGEKVTVP